MLDHIRFLLQTYCIIVIWSQYNRLARIARRIVEQRRALEEAEFEKKRSTFVNNAAPYSPDVQLIYPTPTPQGAFT